MMKLILSIIFLLFFKKKINIKMIMFIYIMMFFLILYPSIFNLFYNNFMLDLLSYGMMILTMWIMNLMVMSKNMKMKKFMNFFIFMWWSLMMCLLISFSINNFLGFYFFFESSLIPILFMILGWGYQPDRIQASIYLLFYTLISSLPLLMMIFLIKNNNYTMNFYMMNNLFMKYNFLFYFIITLAFLIKIPMFLTHIWLPKAHTESPVFGSMILAAIMLKLGGYGLMRIFMFMNYYMMKMNNMYMSICLIGMMLISMNCITQTDFKMMIAYSSVSHMNMMLLNMMNSYYWSMMNSYMMMIAHGMCSSSMFFMLNILYERTHSRSMLINKGMMNFMPKFSMWWFMICICNMAAPMSINMFSEIGMINSMMNWSKITLIFIFFTSMFTSTYSMYLFSFSQQGKSIMYNFSFYNNNLKEFLIISLHWIPMNLLIMNPYMILTWL